MRECMLGVVGDAMGIGQPMGRIHVEFGIDMQRMPRPSHLHAAHPGDAGLRRERGPAARWRCSAKFVIHRYVHSYADLCRSTLDEPGYFRTESC